MDRSQQANDRNDPAVTLSIARQPKSGRAREFEVFLRGIIDAASRSPGYVGSQMFRPVGGERRYRVVIRFARASDLRRWEESEEGQAWLARGDALSADDRDISDITGTAQEQPLALALSPLVGFIRTSVSGIGLLLFGTALALLMANSPLSDWYSQFWTTELTIGTEQFGITESLRHLVNDALMALYFFIVGLEIKRELLVGDLREPRHAALPIAAAVGGALTPALIYTVINAGSGGEMGWGIPIGTDTAFTIGILSLFGDRVRPRLFVFLTAFAIVDDILAVLVIAAFYTETIEWPAVGIALILLGILALANRAGFHRWPIYAFGGLGVWLTVFESGIHGTVAGVLVAMTVPARSWINPSEFLSRGRRAMDNFERACDVGRSMLSNGDQQRAVQALERLTQDVETPMTHLGHQVSPWVTYAVLPLFAFANAGIVLTSGLGAALSSSVTWGVILGLIVGKPLGIMVFSWVAVRTNLAMLADEISWMQVAGVATLGGIGFTMSLFIAELAFNGIPVASAARVGILIGSVIAGAIGYLVLRSTLPPLRDDTEA